jgi:hypothetical protein
MTASARWNVGVDNDDFFYLHEWNFHLQWIIRNLLLIKKIKAQKKRESNISWELFLFLLQLVDTSHTKSKKKVSCEEIKKSFALKKHFSHLLLTYFDLVYDGLLNVNRVCIIDRCWKVCCVFAWCYHIKYINYQHNVMMLKNHVIYRWISRFMLFCLCQHHNSSTRMCRNLFKIHILEARALLCVYCSLVSWIMTNILNNEDTHKNYLFFYFLQPNGKLFGECQMHMLKFHNKIIIDTTNVSHELMYRSVVECELFK